MPETTIIANNASILTRSAGLPYLLAGYISQPYVYDSAKYLVAGTLFEAARRIWAWLVERFKMRYAVSAEFTEGDPAHEWLINMLTQDGIWKKSRNFSVTSKSSARRWGVNLASFSTSPSPTSGFTSLPPPTSDPKLSPNSKALALASGKGEAHADYVPSYNEPHLFKWRGRWCEVRKGGDLGGGMYGAGAAAGLVGAVFNQAPSASAASSRTLSLTIFSLNLGLLNELVEDARERYLETNTNFVNIYSTDVTQFSGLSPWSTPKRKLQRPLDSLILEPGIIDILMDDVKEFFSMESWYQDAGIPHHRGYLLYGPPGTGKTSTIYALAGELGLEIYTISLASGNIDDFFLQRLANAMPKKSILLIEDIDCAFPSREDEEDEELDYMGMMGGMPRQPRMLRRVRSAVTMSGLLNVVDGVGSEEGKLFFATTNYVDRLDAAMMRPGRIDMKFEYKLATTYQASALFDRFFPAPRYPGLAGRLTDPGVTEKHDKPISSLAEEFGESIPASTFSTAELQGYLLSNKTDPLAATNGAKEWVVKELQERQEKKEREEEKKKKWEAARQANRTNMGMRGGYGFGGGAGMGATTPVAPAGINGTGDGTNVAVPGSPASPAPPSPALVNSNAEIEEISTIAPDDQTKPMAVNGYVADLSIQDAADNAHERE